MRQYTVFTTWSVKLPILKKKLFFVGTIAYFVTSISHSAVDRQTYFLVDLHSKFVFHKLCPH